MSQEIYNLRYCEFALSLKDNIESQFLLLGEYLYNIREKELYKPQWESFEEFGMELRGFSSGSLNKLINIYKKLVLEYQIPRENLVKAGGWTLLAELLPIVQNKKEAVHWVEQASLLSRADLKKSLTESKTGLIMSECDHGETMLIRVCKDCGQKWREYEK